MVEREAARAGLRVVALEEGAYSVPRDFTQREDEMLPLLFQDGGGRTTDDGALTVLQGRGVGGSTVHNTNLCKRAPAPRRREARREGRHPVAQPARLRRLRLLRARLLVRRQAERAQGARPRRGR